MRSEYSRGFIIFLLVVLIQFLMGYFGQNIFDLLELNSPFYVESFAFLMDLSTAIVAMVMFRFWCPEMLNRSKFFLVSKRSSAFWGFARARKFFVLSGLMLFVYAMSGLTMNFQIRHFGVHDDAVGFASTQRYAEGDKVNEDDAIQIAVGKKVLARIVAAAGEELVFRWFALTLLLGLMPSESMAVVFSSLFFGISHWFWRFQLPSLADQLVLVLPAIISGIGLGLLYLRLGLWAAVLFHTLGNLITAFKYETMSRIVVATFMVLAVLAATVLIEALCKKAWRRLP